MAEPIRVGVWSDPGGADAAADACAMGDGFVVLADGSLVPERGGAAARAAVAAAAARLGAYSQGEDAVAALKEAFAAADGAARASLGSEVEAGTGVVWIAAALDDTRLHVAHVGVTRAYVLRAKAEDAKPVPARSRVSPPVVLPSGAQLTCVTLDHTAVAARVERGQITPEEAKDHPLRDHLVRALGAREPASPEIVTIEHAQGDRVVLCSAGTWGALEDAELAKLLENAGSAQAASVAVGRAAAEARAPGGGALIVIDFPKELQPAAGGAQSAPGKKAGPEALLEEIGRDLTQLARDDKLDPVIGREEEIRRLGEILLQRKKSNALLVGDAGVGKTCIVEGFARRIGGKRAPKAFRGKRIVEISIAALVAGTKYRGEFEERVQSIVQLAAADPDLLLFIDEFHTIVGAGSGGEALDAANILKPALARGTLRLIGATTTQEYDRHLAKDDALSRRFEVIRVEEPTRGEAAAVLRGLRSRFESHYSLKVADEALDAAVDLSIRYLPERRLPDKAIDLVDQACARRALGVFPPDDGPPSGAEPGNEPGANKDAGAAGASNSSKDQNGGSGPRAGAEKAGAEKAGTEKAGTEKAGTEKAGTGNAAGDGPDGDAPRDDEPPIGRRDVAVILSERCRIPFDLVNQGDRERLLGLSRFLQGRVFGQSAAIARISGMLVKAYSGLKDPRRPIASFLFVGATGVGKTETARALAEYLFVRRECLHRFDMSEYSEKHQIARLIGAPPGYIGHEAEGALTSAVRRRPASVVLFDEVEKAHEDVIMLLLQILDEGELTDGHGRRASFREAIVVMTTNVQPDLARVRGLGFRAGDSASRAHAPGAEPDDALREGLRDRFRPELLGRLGAVVSFGPLDAAASTAIAEKTIRAVLSRLEAHHGAPTPLPEEVRARILEQAKTLRFGAREIERLVEAEIGKLVEHAPA